ncbi:hypothetical protein LQW54_011687 [Pestalotiopsis sp. IQ-011]
MSFPENNRTWRILDAAAQGGYAVGAFNCYNEDGIIAVIRAAQASKSPAIIQLFPWTMHFQGPEFVKYVVGTAHAASVPVAVHLDHCIEPADVEAALDLPFDSVMVDASVHDPKENARQCAAIVERANAKGISIEGEMGRIEGGEDGLPTVDLDAIMTQPDGAEDFVRRMGVQFLAPAFGNIHGHYGPAGPEKYWNLSLPRRDPSIPLVLHGTSGVSNELFHTARKHGMVKINLNKTVRDEYTNFVAENAGKLGLTVLKVKAVEIYAESISRAMKEILDAAGKA